MMFPSSLTRRSTQGIRMSFSSSTASPIIELREYSIFPAAVVKYTQATSAASNLRKTLSPLKYFGLPETGGSLNVSTHLYYYTGGYNERKECRKAMSENKDWSNYLNEVRPLMDTQKSSIFVEAPFIKKLSNHDDYKNKIYGLSFLDDNTFPVAGETVVEFRRYQLKLGYDTVPKFLALYEKGLPSKLLAPGTDPSTSLITLMYSEVGQLNEVIEVWRHSGTDAMEQSRIAARSAIEWREAISSIAQLADTFTNSIHKPLGFSPLR